jgi:putative hemolysin
MSYIIPIILQIILIATNSLFAAAEIAVISVNPAKLEKLAEDGNKKAKKLLKLTKNSSKFLSTIQVAITFAALLGSAFAADSFAEPLSTWFNSLSFMKNAGFIIPESVFVILVTIILSFFSIVLGELVPKRIAMKNAEKVAFGICGLLNFVSIIFAPFVCVLTKSTNLILITRFIKGIRIRSKLHSIIFNYRLHCKHMQLKFYLYLLSSHPLENFLYIP